MKNVTSDKRNLWMFPLGTVGRDMIYNLFTNFIFTYILFTRHLTAAQLGAVTAIMVEDGQPVEYGEPLLVIE